MAAILDPGQELGAELTMADMTLERGAMWCEILHRIDVVDKAQGEVDE